MPVQVIKFPPCSPDLTVLDYYLWNEIVQHLPAAGFTSLVSLRATAGAVVERFKPGGALHDGLVAALKAWPERLRLCAAADGGHFEV